MHDSFKTSSFKKDRLLNDLAWTGVFTLPSFFPAHPIVLECLKGFIKGNKSIGPTSELWKILRGSEQKAVTKIENNIHYRFMSVAKDKSFVVLLAAVWWEDIKTQFYHMYIFFPSAENMQYIVFSNVWQ